MFTFLLIFTRWSPVGWSRYPDAAFPKAAASHGGSPSGLMSGVAQPISSPGRRRTGDDVRLSSIFLAVLATVTSTPSKIDTSLRSPRRTRIPTGVDSATGWSAGDRRRAVRRQIRWPGSRSTPRAGIERGGAASR